MSQTWTNRGTRLVSVNILRFYMSLFRGNTCLIYIIIFYPSGEALGGVSFSIFIYFDIMCWWKTKNPLTTNHALCSLGTWQVVVALMFSIKYIYYQYIISSLRSLHLLYYLYLYISLSCVGGKTKKPPTTNHGLCSLGTWQVGIIHLLFFHQYHIYYIYLFYHILETPQLL